ncbi:MAG: DUF1501 domain-containing protein [Verrucomicrobia bacterium]|nr:MAG: DUF1501 domain-containing protein [Verrucomicrobiota bacterium]TAE88035.1 MAG: DUF1501 domain-containing protein [Verrucomicrobiota bacterium]TAF26259.1 MAG: DUF1501 domain-containing protein [Verrucomicrobiota bacterium]TAF41813.1 MAG: DUF1501 domain-containing protein [Verrucomicrobiota bacterium]
MNLFQQLRFERARHTTRRHFLQNCSVGLGGLWLASQGHGATLKKDPANPLMPDLAHFAPKAKRVIYLHMAGSPSQLELFDHKPELTKLDGKECPQEFLEGKQFAFIQGVPKMLGSQFPFHQAGQSGQWISDRLPHFESMIDEVCFIKSMWTDQFNHGPAQLLLHTGSALLGSPSAGSWATYGLGSENANLPGFIVLTSGGKNPDAGKSVWGSGYLPSVYQGVQCRSQGEPVLYLSNPDGVSQALRRRTLDALNDLNQRVATEVGDPETVTRIAQYEMAFRMQIHASDAFDLKQEPEDIHQLYGTAPGQESFANNCLLARRLAERGVRFIQLFDWGWDSHGTSAVDDLKTSFANKCQQVDQPIAALLKDLKQRGLLDETLVVWSGEFGRTPMKENRGGVEGSFVGRDHSPSAYTLWMAGGGVKRGFSYGETDPIGYEAATNKVSAHDFHATLMTLLGFDHKKLTYPYQGLDQRLSNVTKSSRVVKEIIA